MSIYRTAAGRDWCLPVASPFYLFNYLFGKECILHPLPSPPAPAVGEPRLHPCLDTRRQTIDWELMVNVCPRWPAIPGSVVYLWICFFFPLFFFFFKAAVEPLGTWRRRHPQCTEEKLYCAFKNFQCTSFIYLHTQIKHVYIHTYMYTYAYIIISFKLEKQIKLGKYNIYFFSYMHL